MVNYVPCREDVCEDRGIAPCILNLGTVWRWEVSSTHRPLYSRGKRPLYPSDRRLGGPQSSFGRGGKEKKNPFPGGSRTSVV